MGALAALGGQNEQGRKVLLPEFTLSPQWLPQGRLATSMPRLSLSYSPPVGPEARGGEEKGLEIWRLVGCRGSQGDWQARRMRRVVPVLKNCRGASSSARMMQVEMLPWILGHWWKRQRSVRERALGWQCRTPSTLTRSIYMFHPLPPLLRVLLVLVSSPPAPLGSQYLAVAGVAVVADFATRDTGMADASTTSEITWIGSTATMAGGGGE